MIGTAVASQANGIRHAQNHVSSLRELSARLNPLAAPGPQRERRGRPQSSDTCAAIRCLPDERESAATASSTSRLVQKGLAGVLSAALVLTGAVTPGQAEELNPEEVRPPSEMRLELKPRTSLLIQESQNDRDKADYSHQDLTEALFAETSLKEADLHGSDMRAAVFSRAILYKANLSGVDATDGFFDYALLRGANARGSIFASGNFIRADMGEMDVTNTDFTDALIDNYELQELCSTASGTNPVTGVDTRESLHCDNVKYYKGFNSGGRIEPRFNK